MTTIDTSRLTLRPFTPDDVGAYAAIRANPEVIRHLPGGEARAPEAQAVAERVLGMFIEHRRERGYGPWAVIERATGAFLGHAGLRRVPELEAVELLYMLDSPAWGRGYATEAGRAALQHGFDALALARIVGLVSPANAASMHVLEKLGFRYLDTIEIFGLTARRYELTATST